MMRIFTYIITVFFIAIIFTACRKPVPEGRIVFVSGIVFDSVKNKSLPHAQVYLFGSHQSFSGTYYDNGPLDSAISDGNGKFSMKYSAEGKSIDYGVTLNNLSYGGPYYPHPSNYVADIWQPLFKMNYSINVTNAIVKGRELNYTRIRLKVLSNPFDSFFVSNSVIFQPAILIKGQTIDTTIFVRHLPDYQNIIYYQTLSPRDTVGIAAANASGHWVTSARALTDTINADLKDTILISKTITNSSSMPRQ